MIVLPTGVSTAPSPVARPLRRRYGLIDPVADFGVVGDGATDNSEALMAMRAYMTQYNDVGFKVVFPAGGHYVYNKNIWLNGVNDVIVDGLGSSFQCTESEAWGADASLFSRHIFDDAPPDEPISFSGNGRITGCAQARFETAAKGEYTIKLLPAVSGQPYLSASDLAAGDKVFLWGYDQQLWGFPPNCRHYEWNEVASVDTAAGTVTLVNPLEDEYRDDWRDNDDWDDVWYGSARIFKLHRPNFKYPDRVELRNLTFLQNPNSTSTQGFRFVCDTLILQNVIFPDEMGLFFGQNQIAEVNNCTFARTDIDKLGGSLLFHQCTVNGRIGPATGFKSITARACKILKYVDTCARRNLVEDCIIYGFGESWAINVREAQHIDQFSIRNNTITQTALIRGDLVESFSPVRINDGSTLVIDYTDGKKQSVIRRLNKRSSILVSETSAVQVQKVVWDGVNSQFLVHTNGSGLTLSDTFGAVTVESVSVQNTNVPISPIQLSNDVYGILMKDGRFEQVFRNVGTKDMNTWATLTSFKLEIEQVHANTDGDHDNSLVEAVAFNASGNRIAVLQCSPIHLTNAETGENGDSLTTNATVDQSLPVGAYVKFVRLSCFRVGHPEYIRPFGGTPEEQPVIRLTVNGRSILSS